MQLPNRTFFRIPRVCPSYSCRVCRHSPNLFLYRFNVLPERNSIVVGLGHFLSIRCGDKAVREHSFRQGDVATHQHARPNDAVEPDDIFPDDVYIRRPKLRVVFSVRKITTGQIVCQSIEPNVQDVFAISRHGNPPIERRSRDAQISQLVVFQSV